LNRSAESVLGDGIRVSKKRLVSDDPNATSALYRALHALLWSNLDSSLLPPVCLPRAGRQPLLAYPLKLASMSANALAGCRALLVIVDPEKRSHPPEAVLRTGFGLTAAEARLAARLATGVTIETAADKLGVAKETARNQLKSIFSKTGVHRQAELVALFASLFGGTEMRKTAQMDHAQAVSIRKNR
jgi:DNA-binding CsgD family transcriptional regulator